MSSTKQTKYIPNYGDEPQRTPMNYNEMRGTMGYFYRSKSGKRTPTGIFIRKKRRRIGRRKNRGGTITFRVRDASIFGFGRYT